MVVAPSFNRSRRSRSAPLKPGARAAIGLHVTLTAPFRPLSAEYPPVDNGAFLPLGDPRALPAAALDRGARGRSRRADPAVKHTFGRPPDFVDGHQHVHMFPQVSDVVLAVARSLAPEAWMRQCGRAGADCAAASATPRACCSTP